MGETLNEMNAALDAGMSQVVKLWVNWMMLTFIVAIPLAFKYVQARWAVLALLLTGLGAIIVWKLTQNVHLFGIVHFVVWLPLAIYLWKTVLSKSARSKSQPRLLLIWACIIVATISVSLVFDARDIFLISTGAK